jgi:hypothetical protein
MNILVLINISSTAIQQLAHDSMIIIYTDSNNQQYFSILAEMIVNYKEQALITRVKSSQHCTIYTVPLSKYKDLL